MWDIELIKNDEGRYILLQVFLIICIVAIPIYFYMDSSLENKKLKDKISLKNHTLKISNIIYKLKDKNISIKYPKSDIFKLAIYDKNNKAIFIDNSEFFEYEKSICTKEYLNKNILQAKYIINCKKITKSGVLLNVLFLSIVVIILVFISSFIIIKQTIRPYKRLNEYFDNFLKDAMHELKTPIGVAKFNVDMLSMRIKEDKYLLRIRYSLKNMTIIYEDLEYYVKQNIIEDEKSDIDFSLFLEKRCEYFKDLSDAKDIKLESIIDQNIFIFFNEVELYRIVDNTLSNAIKYSKNKTQITISLQRDENNIIFKVQDQGIGIKDTKKIFYRYYRGDKVTGGFGIGLNIVKKICDKNNVRIKVDSKLNQGSIFAYKFKKE